MRAAAPTRNLENLGQAWSAASIALRRSVRSSRVSSDSAHNDHLRPPDRMVCIVEGYPSRSRPIGERVARSRHPIDPTVHVPCPCTMASLTNRSSLIGSRGGNRRTGGGRWRTTPQRPVTVYEAVSAVRARLRIHPPVSAQRASGSCHRRRALCASRSCPRRRVRRGHDERAPRGLRRLHGAAPADGLLRPRGARHRVGRGGAAPAAPAVHRARGRGGGVAAGSPQGTSRAGSRRRRPAPRLRGSRGRPGRGRRPVQGGAAPPRGDAARRGPGRARRGPRPARLPRGAGPDARARPSRSPPPYGRPGAGRGS